MNLISKDIVTQDFPLADEWAAVPAPASIIEQIYPPWVFLALFKWIFFIFVLNSYLFLFIFLNKRPPLFLKNPGFLLFDKIFSLQNNWENN